MIIAHLARACYPFQPYGGLERHVYQLTLELARLDHRIELYLPPPTTGQLVTDPAWRENVRSHYLPYTTFSLFRRNSIPDRLLNYSLFSRRLGQAVGRASYRPAIVHAHGLAGLGYASQKKLVAPLVLNPHGMEEFKARSWAKQLAYGPFRTLLRQTAARSAAVVATDDALVPEVERYLAVGPARIATIPNAIALDELDQPIPAAALQELAARFWIASENRLVFLSVGRLEANKGFDVMLQALARLRSTLDAGWAGWRWIVVGSGSQKIQLEKQAARLGLTDRVGLVGPVDTDSLQGLYQLADIFVHPTRYEGSSLVTLEALARRLPVVASATGGLPDKVFSSGQFENGRLCPPDDPAALANALLELARLSPAARQQLGQRGRALVESRFSWPAAARQTVALYEQLLSTRPRPLL